MQRASLLDLEEDVFDVAFVRVFIIINPGKIKRVYETPWISEIRCSKVNPKIAIYRPEVIKPGKTVCL